MSNGAACCAMEICCNRAKRSAMLVEKFGVEYADKIERFMSDNKIVFAPASMQTVMDEIAAMARAHPKD